ncbi:uncharacterized protein METZ01_LOCUS453768, partial [marine metagenome]
VIGRIGVAFVMGVLMFTVLVASADARVVRIVVERTTPYAGGRTFGD